MQMTEPPRRPPSPLGVPSPPPRRPAGARWAFEGRPVVVPPPPPARSTRAIKAARAGAAFTGLEAVALVAAAAFALAQTVRAGLTTLSTALLALAAGIVAAAVVIAWGSRQVVLGSAAWRVFMLFAEAFLACFLGGLAFSAATTSDGGGGALIPVLLSATAVAGADLLCVALATPPRVPDRPAPPAPPGRPAPRALGR